jgi:hypothetical protein
MHADEENGDAGDNGFGVNVGNDEPGKGQEYQWLYSSFKQCVVSKKRSN